MSLALVACVPSLRADRVTPAKPLFTEVFFRPANDREKDHPHELTGDLVSYDDDDFTLRVGAAQKTVRWTDVTATSAFTLRSRLIDKTKADQWLSLATFGWSMGATQQAKIAIDHAVGIDPSLRGAADQVTASPAGSAVTASPSDTPTTDTPMPAKSSDHSANRELIGQQGQTASVPPGGAGSPVRPDDGEPWQPTTLYKKANASEAADAIAADRAMAEQLHEQLHVTFATIETPHFLIFTDWDPREFEFLRENFEDAYTAVSTQFDIPASQNVFVGKLPVFMFANFKDYAKLTDSIGFLGKPVTKDLRGYYQGTSDGFGRMIMYKPQVGEKTDAEKQWAHVLVHEFTHAFVARYQTNAHVPRWLNEGIAEVIAAQHFPFDWTTPIARRMASLHHTAGTLFDDEKMPSGEWYPVMQTMVAMLLEKDPTAFLGMFTAIKSGTDGETALKKFYGLDYGQLMQTWRSWIERRQG